MSPANSKVSSRHGCRYRDRGRVATFARRAGLTLVRIAVLFSIFICAAVSLRAEISVEIDLEQQAAYLLKNGRPVLASPISSGRYGHLTKTGSFKILEKERTHYSSLYGKIVDGRGNTIVADADADMPVRGGKFIPAPMHYFMRFNGADGMHAGYLPGYPASHGCVRMPQEYAIAFFNSVSAGTPVTVFGRTSASRYGSQSGSRFPRDRNRFADPRIGPRFDPRFGPPPPMWWR